MTLRAISTAVLLGFLATACTAQEHPDPTPKGNAVSRGGTGASAADGGGEGDRSDVLSDDGPLTVDGQGSLCIDTTVNNARQFTYGEDLLETSAPIELDAVALLNPRGIRVLRAWTFPSRGVPYAGAWSGWPLPDVVTSHGRLEWSLRVKAEGSQLDPGNLYNFLLRMVRQPGNEVQGFDAIRVTYHTSDRSYVLQTEFKVRFQRDCR